MDYPLILYVLSFNHDLIHQLVSKKSLSKYAAGQRVSLPSVLIKMNILRERVRHGLVLHSLQIEHL